VLLKKKKKNPKGNQVVLIKKNYLLFFPLNLNKKLQKVVMSFPFFVVSLWFVYKIDKIKNHATNFQLGNHSIKTQKKKIVFVSLPVSLFLCLAKAQYPFPLHITSFLADFRCRF